MQQVAKRYQEGDFQEAQGTCKDFNVHGSH